MTTKGLSFLASLPRLKHLEVSECAMIDDSIRSAFGVSIIRSDSNINSFPALEVLDLSGCHAISEEVINVLRLKYRDHRNSTHLSALHVIANGRIAGRCGVGVFGSDSASARPDAFARPDKAGNYQSRTQLEDNDAGTWKSPTERWLDRSLL